MYKQKTVYRFLQTFNIQVFNINKQLFLLFFNNLPHSIPSLPTFFFFPSNLTVNVSFPCFLPPSFLLPSLPPDYLPSSLPSFLTFFLASAHSSFIPSFLSSFLSPSLFFPSPLFLHS